VGAAPVLLAHPAHPRVHRLHSSILILLRPVEGRVVKKNCVFHLSVS
jgi:hypothetical protein